MASNVPSDPTQSCFLKEEGSKASMDCNSLVSNIIQRLRNHRKHSLSSSTRTYFPFL